MWGTGRVGGGMVGVGGSPRFLAGPRNDTEKGVLGVRGPPPIPLLRPFDPAHATAYLRQGERNTLPLGMCAIFREHPTQEWRSCKGLEEGYDLFSEELNLLLHFGEGVDGEVLDNNVVDSFPADVPYLLGDFGWGADAPGESV